MRFTDNPICCHSTAKMKGTVTIKVSKFQQLPCKIYCIYFLKKVTEKMTYKFKFQSTW